jgi:hypothetical protein
MAERSSPCRYQPFASMRTASSLALNSFIYTSPSVHERLAYGVLVPEAERAAEMTRLVKALERLIDGHK